MSDLRLAGSDDIETVLQLCREFHVESPYASIEFSESAARNCIEDALVRGVVILFKDKGIIAGLVTPVPFSTGLVATEIAWFVRKIEGRVEALKSLQEAFEYWARNVAGAEYLWCGSFKHNRYFLDRGYTQAETMYIAELK